MRAALILVLSAVLIAPGLRAQTVGDAPGAVLRGLDKQSGQTIDLSVKTGESAAFGPLSVSVSACRYPADNAAADAFAHVKVTDAAGATLFDGWMIASSPALSAMDHPRYDIWVESCMSAAG